MKKPLSFLLILVFGLVPSLVSADAVQSDSYVLRPNDVVSMSVFDEADLSSQVAILKSGQASFPLIGTLKIGGLSLTAATSLITERYAADYLRDPKITLTVTEYASEFVTVIGRVGTPGQVPLPQFGNLDIDSALASVGGITELADPENIKFIKKGGKAINLTLTQIRGEAGRTVMQHGDQLVVHESLFAHRAVSMIGQVGRPGAVPIPKDGKLDLATALAAVGGPGPLANTDSIEVTTADGASSYYSYESIQTGQAGKRALKGGDQVNVKKSLYVGKTFTILGQVKNPGPHQFPLNGRLELMNAIAEAGGFTPLANPKKVTLTRNGNDTVLDTRKLGQAGQGPVMLAPGDIIVVAERWF